MIFILFTQKPSAKRGYLPLKRNEVFGLLRRQVSQSLQVTVVDKRYILAFSPNNADYIHDILCISIFYAINNLTLPVIARRAQRDVAIQKTGCS